MAIRDTNRILAEIAAERDRQVSAHGYDDSHDDRHTKSEIAIAAACFALSTADAHERPSIPAAIALLWPWQDYVCGRRPARRALIIAAAMLIAEIERLDRATGRG